MRAVLFCPDAASLAGLSVLVATYGDLVEVVHRDHEQSSSEHVLALVDRLQSWPDDQRPELWFSADAFGWACVGMLTELRDWLGDHQWRSLVVYSGAINGPAAMAAEAVVRVRAEGAVDLARDGSAEWLAARLEDQPVQPLKALRRDQEQAARAEAADA